jgi:hypothetical protein
MKQAREGDADRRLAQTVETVHAGRASGVEPRRSAAPSMVLKGNETPGEAPVEAGKAVR